MGRHRRCPAGYIASNSPAVSALNSDLAPYYPLHPAPGLPQRHSHGAVHRRQRSNGLQRPLLAGLEARARVLKQAAALTAEIDWSAEVSSSPMAILSALKRTMDPNDLLNPGRFLRPLHQPRHRAQEDQT